MPTRTFDDVVQRLVTHVPGCPFPVIEKFVRDAAIEVCAKTLVWKYEQPTIRLTPGIHDYEYESPSAAEVHAFVWVTVINTPVNSATPENGTPMFALTLEQLYKRYPNWPNHNLEARSQPRHIGHLDADHFAVAPIPDDAMRYDVRMLTALKPLRDAAGMDETVLDDIENVVMDGALSELYLLPEKNWTDRKLGEFHRTRYLKRTSETRARANLGAGRGSMTVKMRGF